MKVSERTGAALLANVPYANEGAGAVVPGRITFVLTLFPSEVVSTIPQSQGEQPH